MPIYNAEYMNIYLSNCFLYIMVRQLKMSSFRHMESAKEKMIRAVLCRQPYCKDLHIGGLNAIKICFEICNIIISISV